MFVQNLLGLHHASGLAAVADHRASLRYPPKTVDHYLDISLMHKWPESVVSFAEIMAAYEWA